MGVDQLVTGGDFDDPVVDSLTSDSVNTESATINSSKIYIQDTEPTDAEEDDVWIDTS